MNEKPLNYKELTRKLKEIQNVSSRLLRLNFPDLFSEVVLHATHVGHTNQYLIDMLLAFGDYVETISCASCGMTYSSRDTLRKTCCSSCQMKMIHKNMNPEKKRSIAEKKRIRDAEWLRNGKLSEYAVKGHITRNTTWSDERKLDYKKNISETQKRLGLLRKQANINLFKNRLDTILSLKDPVFVLRMLCRYRRKSSVRKSRVEQIIKMLHDLGYGEIFDGLLDENTLLLVKHGYSITTKCVGCGVQIFRDRPSSNIRFCSHKCFSNSEYNKNLTSEQMRNLWKIPEIREKFVTATITRHSNSTPESRKAWSKKILSTMGKEGILTRRDKALQTKLVRGMISSIDVWGETEVTREKRLYFNNVMKHTKYNSLNVTGIELRGKRTFHLDHIFPIQKGFIFSVPPELIGSLDNLRMLWCGDNQSKNSKITEIPGVIEEFLKMSGSYEVVLEYVSKDNQNTL